MIRKKTLTALAALVAVGACAEDEVGKVLDKYVSAGRIAGVVSVLSDADCNEQYDCAGWAGIEAKRKMTPDMFFAVKQTLATKFGN